MDDVSLVYNGESFCLFLDENIDVNRELETVPAVSLMNAISSNNMESKVNIKISEEVSDSNILKSLKTYSKRRLTPSVNKAVNEQNGKNGYKAESYDKEINSTNQQTGKSDSSEKLALELQLPDKDDSGNQTVLEIIQNTNVSEINMDELKMDFENSMLVKTLPIKKRRTTSRSDKTVQETKSETLSFAVTSVIKSPDPLNIISTNLNSDSGIGSEEWKTESDKPVKKRRRINKSTSSSQSDAMSEISSATPETKSPTMNVKSLSENKIISNDISSTNKRCEKRSKIKVQKSKVKKSLKEKVDLVKKESRIFPKSQLNVFKSNRKEKSSQNQHSANKIKSLSKIVDQNSSEIKSSKVDTKDVTELQLSVDPSKCQSSKSDSDMHKEKSVSKLVPLQYLEKDLLSQEAIENVHSSTEKTVASDDVKASFSSCTVFESERRKSLRGRSKKLQYGNFEYPDVVKRAKKPQEMEGNEVISENCKLNGIKYPNTTQQNEYISKRKNVPLVDEMQNTKCKKKEVEFYNNVSSETASGENSPNKMNYTTTVTKTRMLTRKLSKSIPDNKTEHNGSKSNEMQFLNSIQRDILNIEKSQPFVSLVDCNKNPSFIQSNISKRKLPVIEEISTPIKVSDALNSGVNYEEKEICDNENIHQDEKSSIEIENPDMQTFSPCSNKLKDENKFCIVNTFTTNKLNKLSNDKFGIEAPIENDINSVKTKISQNDVLSPKIADRKLVVRSNSKKFRKNIKVSSESEEQEFGEASKDVASLEVTPNSKKDLTVKLGMSSSSSSKILEESELSPFSAEHRKRSQRGQTASVSAKTEVCEGKGKSLSNFLHVTENNTEKFITDSSTTVHKQPSLMDMVKRYSLSSKNNSVDSPWSPKNNHIVNKRLSVQKKTQTCTSFHSSPSIEQNKLEQTSSVARYVKKSKANVNKLQKVIKSNSVKTKRNSKRSGKVPNTQQTQSKIISEVSTGILKKKAVSCMSPVKKNDSEHEFTDVQETSSVAAVKILTAKKKSMTTRSKASFASIEASKVENKIGTGIAKKVIFDLPQVKQTVENSNASILNAASVPQIMQNEENSIPVLNSIPVSQIIQTAQNNNVSIMNSVPVSQIMQATENNSIPINSVSGNFSAPKVMNIFGNCTAGNSNLLVPAALPTNFYPPLNAVIPCYSQITPHNTNPYVIIPPAIQFQNNSKSYLLPALPARLVSDVSVQVSTFKSKCPSSKDNCVHENIAFLSEKALPNSSDNSKCLAESSSTRLERPVEEHSAADLFQSSSLLFSDFLHFVRNVASEIQNNSVMTSKFHAEKWFEKNSFSRNMTVRQFCTNSKLMKTLSGQFCQKVDEYNDVSVQYKFPDGFEDFELLEVLKDYLNFHLKAIQDHFSLNTLPFSSESIISYAYSVLSFREGMYISCLLRKSCSELEIKDLLPCFLLSGLLVIYNEFSEIVQEQYLDSNVNS